MAGKVELGEWERWYAEGNAVALLSYIGSGYYDAEVAIVTRVTPAQIITTAGRFWRKTSYRVGTEKTRALLGRQAARWRIVPLTNPHAAKLITVTAECAGGIHKQCTGNCDCPCHSHWSTQAQR